VKVEAVVAALETLAPPHLAEPWDNVGLLVGSRTAEVRRVLLTIDLTEEVVEEAIAREAQMVVAYHPPLFEPLRRLTDARPGERLILAAARANLAVHAPHTALDAAPGGVNDWLAQGLGPGSSAPLGPAPAPGEAPRAPGRLRTLAHPATLAELAARLRAHLGTARPLLAATPFGADSKASHAVIGLCAGAGGALLAPALGAGASLFLTGEMRHHDVLAARAAGCAVLLAGHTNTERGYLPVLARRLGEALAGLEILRAERDRDPLQPLD